jgi:hypothetical protein
MAKYSSPITEPRSPWRASRLHPSAEAPELGKVSGVLDIDWPYVAVHDDRFVLRESAASLLVATHPSFFE